MPVRHVVLDWDGTLLDSVAIFLAIDNTLGERFGWPPVDLAYLRANLTRQWRDYYDGLRALAGGSPLTDDELPLLSEAWSVEHELLLAGASLLPDVRVALDRLRGTGATMSVCSMQGDRTLQRSIDEFQLRGYFVRVDGRQVRDDGRTGKAEHLREHLDGLRSAGFLEAAEEVVVIGDNPDDAEAASANGASAVLVATGEVSRERLEATGTPVVDTLEAALDAIGVSHPAPPR